MNIIEKGKGVSGGSTGVISGSMPAIVANDCAGDEMAKLRAVSDEAQKLRLGIQHELELVKQIRAEAERYQLGTEAKARSQSQLIMLQARLATRKELAELKREVSEEIQKLLVDIRMLRIASQEELEAQRKFTNAARICALSYPLQGKTKGSSEDEREAVGVPKL